MRECPCLWKTHISIWGWWTENHVNELLWNGSSKKKNCFTWWLQHLCGFGIVSKWKTINLKYLIHFPSRLSILVSNFLLFCLEYLDSCLLIPLDGVSIEVIDELYAPESSSKPQAGPHACLIGGIWQVDLIFLIQPPGLPPTLLAAPSQTPLLIPSCLS